MIKLFAIFISLFILSISSYAESEGIMNRLFAPGPLILGHQNLEGSQCLKCHESGQGVPDSKCLACHKEIKAFVEKKSGFHGTLKEACIKCHSDHKERTFDSTKFDEKKFDHTKTAFSLTGKHGNIKCIECHKVERGIKRVRPHDTKYLGAAATCRTCHQKNDIHFYKNDWAKKDCNSCHGVESWKKDIKFNHKDDTKYDLVGKHAEISCKLCHNPDKLKPTVSIYKWPSLEKSKCLSCHDNFHKENLSPKFRGGDCTTCHTQTTWKIVQFKHEVTTYPLRGKHLEKQCLDCHKQKTPNLEKSKVVWTGLKADCLTCHTDTHRYGFAKPIINKNLNQCLSCHDESSWKNIHDFSHNAHTRYSIDGAHKTLKCAQCHLEVTKKPIDKKLPGIYQWPKLMEKTCESCHSNPHLKVFDKKLLAQRCTACHTTEGWKVVKANKDFNHTKTRFPLTGKHVTTTCTQCHIKDKKQIFKWESKDKGFCIECHDNVHKTQFTEKQNTKSCSECHQTDSFKKRLVFDHTLVTGYALNGAHKNQACIKCHQATTQVFPFKPITPMSQFLFPNLSKDICLTCHQDVHKGQLGSKCLTCHTEEKWKPTKFDHQTQSSFPLTGKHEKIACIKCHEVIPNVVVVEFNKKIPVMRFKGMGKQQCTTCHQDVHKGQLGSNCLSCHNSDSWFRIKFDHQTQSQFPLKGKHQTVKCIKCHTPIPNQIVVEFKKQVPVIRFKGLGMQSCTSCHKDYHLGKMGPSCSSCHNEQGWKTTKDFHKNFSLSGVHFTLQCSECHIQNRKLSGLSQECSVCHKKDDIHSGTLPKCAECHRQQFWENTKFKHSLTTFPLRGAHRTLQCQECHASTGIYQGLSSACVSCHLKDAVAATSRAHTPIASFNDCTTCHKHQFSFK